MKDIFALLDGTARRRFILALFLSTLAGAAGTALLGLSGWFLTASALAGIAGAGFTFNHLYPSAGVRGFAFTRVLARYAEQLVGHDATLRLSQTLRSSLFASSARSIRGIAPLPGATLAALIDDVETVEGGFLRVLSPLAAVLAAIMIALGFTAAADPLICLLTLAGVLIAGFWLPFQATRAVHNATETLSQQTEDLRASVTYLVENAIELDVYNALNQQCQITTDALDSHQHSLGRIERPFRRLAPLNAIIGGILTFLLIWRGAESGTSLALAAGGGLAILSAFDALGSMTKVLEAAPRAKTSARRLAQRLAAEESVAQPDVDTAAPLETLLPITAETLYLRAANDAPEIGPLQFTLKAGSVTFVTGPSGCGKSTLLETLLRLHPPARGTLRYGVIHSGNIRTPSVLAHMSISPQFEAFLPGTVRDQFYLANPDATDEEIWQALSLAELDHVIRARPSGLDHVLQEGAAGFSGGEMRRLNLARALITPAEILLLDEPFAGLEPDLIKKITHRLTAWAVSGEKALVIASHEAMDLNWGPLKTQNISLSL